MARTNARWAIASVLTLAALLAAPGTSAGGTSPRRAAEADSLHRRAIVALARGTLDARRIAFGELERASLLDPGRLEIWLEFGRLCLESGQRQRGRACYERAKRVAPDDADAYIALGSAWKWEWLSSFDDSALARAQWNLARAAALVPDRAGVWSELAALELSRGRISDASRAATRARAADLSGWEPLVALACVSYRAGRLDWADSAFRAARERVPDSLRPRFDAVVPASEEGAATSLRIDDPDLTTPENEAELDHLTRLGLALLLFRDAHGMRWDMRNELFVRYGPPATVEINPLSSPLAHWYDRNRPEPLPGQVNYSPEPMFYPFNVQAWSYPELGIRIALWDRSLTQSFQLPVAKDRDPDPRSDPTLLASRPDLVALGGGRGVYRAMAPGSVPIPARGQIARFPGHDGAVLAAHLATAGEPTDTLSGAWGLISSDGRVIRRGSGSLSISSCDPTGMRVADFTVAVPPGSYLVDLAVSGTRGRRGLVRLAVTVPPPDSGLSLSDLVILCGIEGAAIAPDVIRIEPDMERRLAGSRPLVAYFEMDRLALGSDGRARFAYTYSVVPVDEASPGRRRPPAAFEASREESHDGTRRRQFVTIPTRSIRPGRYELVIEVRDMVAGTRAAAVMRFDRE